MSTEGLDELRAKVAASQAVPVAIAVEVAVEASDAVVAVEDGQIQGNVGQGDKVLFCFAVAMDGFPNQEKLDRIVEKFMKKLQKIKRT